MTSTSQDLLEGYRSPWASTSKDRVREINLTPRPDETWKIPDSIHMPIGHGRWGGEGLGDLREDPKFLKSNSISDLVPGESGSGDSSTRTSEFSTSSFLEHYWMEYNFWDTLAEATKAICEEEVINKRRIKCHITCRAKSDASVAEKVKRKEKEQGYKFASRAKLEESLIDLAGVRITLAFPKDVQEIKNILEHYFGNVEQRYWGLDTDGKVTEDGPKERFIGYRATHFLVKWSQQGNIPGYKLLPKHTGKTIEIQVTSIMMNAWQEAQHDLVYKQLNGVPSEDERNLLAMINGLAHAGEVALTQLQICVQRRIEDNTREFADEYEVRAWLIKHVPDILKFGVWDGQGPYMRRLSTLFNILRIFNLKKPLNLNQDLLIRVRNWNWSKTYEEQSKFLSPVLEWIFSPLNLDEDLEGWKKAFRNDATDWAITSLCSLHCRELSGTTYGNQSYWDEQKAFFLTNSINFALADGFVRQGWIQDLLIQVLSRHPEQGPTLLRSWFTILNGSHDDSAEDDRMDGGRTENEDMKAGTLNEAHENHSANMSQLWDTFWEVAREWDSRSLRVNLAMSFSGIVAIPATSHADFMNESKPRFTVWHGPDPSNIDDPQWKDMITILPANKKLPLNKFEWKMEQIRLIDIAKGHGWFPEYTDEPLEVHPLSTDITPRPVGSLDPERVQNTDWYPPPYPYTVN